MRKLVVLLGAIAGASALIAGSSLAAPVPVAAASPESICILKICLLNTPAPTPVPTAAITPHSAPTQTPKPNGGGLLGPILGGGGPGGIIQLPSNPGPTPPSQPGSIPPTPCVLACSHPTQTPGATAGAAARVAGSNSVARGARRASGSTRLAAPATGTPTNISQPPNGALLGITAPPAVDQLGSMSGLNFGGGPFLLPALTVVNILTLIAVVAVIKRKGFGASP